MISDAAIEMHHDEETGRETVAMMITLVEDGGSDLEIDMIVVDEGNDPGRGTIGIENGRLVGDVVGIANIGTGETTPVTGREVAARTILTRGPTAEEMDRMPNRPAR